MESDQSLLARYQPRLILLPQDTSRHRPWSRWFKRVRSARGDYHPCSAEFFLSFVFQRNKPKSWTLSILQKPHADAPTGLAALKAKVAAAGRDATLNWEIDIVPIESQDAEQAWPAYARMLASEGGSARKIYARCVRTAAGVALSYWFLYAYNDAPNKHEGDWEMVVVQLDPAENPVQAAYASHRSGLRRLWSAVEREGDRPLTYVARGSHACYFDHKPQGHRTNSAIVPQKALPPPIERALQTGSKLLQDAIVFLRLQDRTPVHPDGPAEDPHNAGEFLEAELVVLPDLADAADDSFWWMNLRCPWGSRHTRLFGDTAPSPPWEQGLKWTDPLAWVQTLDLDEV